jgi:hypothetical protein
MAWERHENNIYDKIVHWFEVIREVLQDPADPSHHQYSSISTPSATPQNISQFPKSRNDVNNNTCHARHNSPLLQHCAIPWICVADIGRPAALGGLGASTVFGLSMYDLSMGGSLVESLLGGRWVRGGFAGGFARGLTVSGHISIRFA